MNAVVNWNDQDIGTQLSFGKVGRVFGARMTLEAVRERAPAVFATGKDERLSARYAFIPTERVLSGLMDAGFTVVDARQSNRRGIRTQHGRHLVRLRRRVETIQLRDSVPEVVFLNSHDGSSAYQLRMGLYRAICTNGMIVSCGAFPAVCVTHRGDVADQVIEGAVKLSDRFDELAAQVDLMEQHQLGHDEQRAFAECALALRYPSMEDCGVDPMQLLFCRRLQDVGDDLWNVMNRVQENLIGGGAFKRAANGRWMRMRRVSAIRAEVKLNTRLWELAAGLLR